MSDYRSRGRTRTMLAYACFMLERPNPKTKTLVDRSNIEDIGPCYRPSSYPHWLQSVSAGNLRPAAIFLANDCLPACFLFRVPDLDRECANVNSYHTQSADRFHRTCGEE
ncbi:Fe-S oxidoreductase [Anopheles sinensis]|uniref:Fe-S oxidoreductase n=1 Tax=Anopheles sinensis TaxID=74873 RepID=A0A084VBK3_ANOSI|nr:Fe-S oxidoreductase [Anopheles sinensis]